MLFSLSLLSLAISFILLRLVVNLCYRKKIFDGQDGRKIHSGNIPRVGGIAFVPAAIIAFLIFVLYFSLTGDNAIIGVHKSFIHDAIVVVCAIAIIYGFGVIDDIKGLRYRDKFGYQIAVGLLLCFCGIYLRSLQGILGLYNIPLAFGFFVTIFLLVLAINAFNFIDGIDGLSSGIAILSLSYYAVVLHAAGNQFYVFAVLMAVALLPFFYFNVFGRESRKNKTFMGDTGSTVLGLVLFLLAIIVNEEVDSQELYKNSFVLGITPLLLPFYDVFSVVFYRMINGKNPFKADDNHFHHKLLRLGLSQHMTLIVELVVFVLICTWTLALVKYINLNIIIGTSLLLWIVVNMWLANKVKEKPIIKQ